FSLSSRPDGVPPPTLLFSRPRRPFLRGSHRKPRATHTAVVHVDQIVHRITFSSPARVCRRGRRRGGRRPDPPKTPSSSSQVLLFLPLSYSHGGLRRVAAVRWASSPPRFAAGDVPPRHNQPPHRGGDASLHLR
ncbi:hypothetical protein SORBI_3009G149200, partial [Sorghum bicolor]